jgi:hypothetical protein
MKTQHVTLLKADSAMSNIQSQKGHVLAPLQWPDHHPILHLVS